MQCTSHFRRSGVTKFDLKTTLCYSFSWVRNQELRVPTKNKHIQKNYLKDRSKWRENFASIDDKQIVMYLLFQILPNVSSWSGLNATSYIYTTVCGSNDLDIKISPCLKLQFFKRKFSSLPTASKLLKDNYSGKNVFRWE